MRFPTTGDGPLPGRQGKAVLCEGSALFSPTAARLGSTASVRQAPVSPVKAAPARSSLQNTYPLAPLSYSEQAGAGSISHF